MKPIVIDIIKVMNLGLGRSIYSLAQLEEFARFQKNQGTRHAFIAESAERAYNERVAGEWGSGLTDFATESLIDAAGYHLVPIYRVIGPTAAVALLKLFLMGILRMTLDIVIRAIAIARVRGCGWWLIGAFWGNLFQVAVAPVQWAGRQPLGHPSKTWSNEFLGRRDNDRIYLVPIIRDEKFIMGNLAAARVVEHKANRGGQPLFR